jgi:hypothetical protein
VRGEEGGRSTDRRSTGSSTGSEVNKSQ